MIQTANDPKKEVDNVAKISVEMLSINDDFLNRYGIALTHEIISFAEIWTASFQISCVNPDHKHNNNIQLMVIHMFFSAFSHPCLKVTNYTGSGVIFFSATLGAWFRASVYKIYIYIYIYTQNVQRHATLVS
jgi:hypothetical protein